MKKGMLLLLILLVTGCGQGQPEESGPVYRNITAEEARQIMDSGTACVILDVRTQEEYLQSHIPGAILIPHDEIEARAEAELPDKDMLILIYCRSGNRSKKAAQILLDLGYTNILEFGGIMDWPYEVE